MAPSCSLSKQNRACLVADRLERSGEKLHSEEKSFRVASKWTQSAAKEGLATEVYSGTSEERTL